MADPTSLSQTLLVQADVRWRQILSERPDLGDAIDLQRSLVAKLIAVGEELEQGDWTAVTIQPTEAAAKLAAGIPLLRQLAFSPPMPRLDTVLREFCLQLAQGGAGEAAAHIHQALQEGRIDAGSLLAASLSRNQRSIRTGAAHLGLAPDLLWLVAELSVGPLAHILQRAHLSSDAIVQDAVAAWDRGFCPACGSWPALAETGTAPERHDLRCSFCGATWGLSGHRCAYCGDAGPSFTTIASDDRRPARRLELCRGCERYLKAVETEHPIPFALLPVEDLGSSDLDVAALERGYTRPSLPEIATPEGCPDPTSVPGER